MFGNSFLCQSIDPFVRLHMELGKGSQASRDLNVHIEVNTVTMFYIERTEL